MVSRSRSNTETDSLFTIDNDHPHHHVVAINQDSASSSHHPHPSRSSRAHSIIETVHHAQELSAHSHTTKWLVLLVYALLSASNGFQWINYAPIVKEVKRFFHMDSLEVNTMSTIYTVVYPALIIVGCVTFQKLGSHGGLVVGALLNAIGASLKVVAVLWAPHFAMLAFTQTINAFSEVFFLSLPPLLAAVWFHANQRTLATSIGVMSNSLGTAFGFLIPPLVVNKQHDGQSAFLLLFGVQAVIAVLIFLITLVLPKRPAHLPSLTAAKDTTLQELIPSLRFLITHPPFLMLAFASGLSNDSLGTFASFLAQLVQPFGVSELDAGWIGFAMTISGSVASTLVGVYVDRYRNYKPTIMVFSLGAATCFSAVTLCLLYVADANMFGPVFVFVTLMGGFLSAQIPLQLEYAVELTYPKPEGISTAFLLCLSGILTPLLTLGGSDMIGNNPTKKDVIFFMMCCVGLSCVAATMQLCIKDVKRRVAIEHAVPVTRHESYLEEHEKDH